MLGKAKNHFIFSIESVGQVPVWSPNSFLRGWGQRILRWKSIGKNVRLKHETGMNMNEHDMQIENLVIQVYL